MNKQHVIEIIDKKVNQAIALVNHIKFDNEPEANYVAEKTDSFPVLDMKNNAVRNRIRAIFLEVYGVDLTEY